MSDREGSRSFLDRWSARKRQNEQADSELATAADVYDSASAQPASDNGLSVEQADPSNTLHPLATEPLDPNQQNPQALNQEQADAPLLTDDDMPPIESLSSDSDLSGFFSKGVSTALKRAALRHVFQQPQFNVRDGLNDYDGDYTVFEPLGDTVTSDMKWHVARKERERLEAEARELELQERLAMEQQEHDDQEIEPEPATAEEPGAGDSDMSNSEAEQDEAAVANATDEVRVSSRRVESEQGDDALLEVAESLQNAPESKPPKPERVAGKLRRLSDDGAHGNNSTLQIADAHQENNDNEQDYE